MPRSENAWGRRKDQLNEFRWTNQLTYDQGFTDGKTLARLGSALEVAAAKVRYQGQNHKPYCQGFVDGLEEGLNH